MSPSLLLTLLLLTLIERLANHRRIRSAPPEVLTDLPVQMSEAPMGSGLAKLELARIRRYLKRSAMAMLARREHSQFEVRSKLTDRGQRKFPDFDDLETELTIPLLITDVLETLVAQDLQSDLRFAQSLVRRRREKEGAQRLEQQLKWHKIDPQIRSTLLAELKETELQRTRDAHLRRFGTPAQSFTEKARQSRFLRARGFCPHAIRQVLRETD